MTMICVKIARLEEHYDGVAKSIDKIEKALTGNGKPGLVDRVDDLYKYVYMIIGGIAVIGVLWTVLTFIVPFITHRGLPL